MPLSLKRQCDQTLGAATEDKCGDCDADAATDCRQDCLGDWGGAARNDGCLVCQGDNSSCADCGGVPNGPNVVDMCEHCDGNVTNDCGLDCAGGWGGPSLLDACDVCDGDNACVVCDAGQEKCDVRLQVSCFNCHTQLALQLTRN